LEAGSLQEVSEILLERAAIFYKYNTELYLFTKKKLSHLENDEIKQISIDQFFE
jgi:hypothetical protein